MLNEIITHRVNDDEPIRIFAAGPFPCKQNAEAIQHIERALESLKDRTREREQESTKARKKEAE